MFKKLTGSIVNISEGLSLIVEKLTYLISAVESLPKIDKGTDEVLSWLSHLEGKHVHIKFTSGKIFVGPLEKYGKSITYSNGEEVVVYFIAQGESAYPFSSVDEVETIIQR